VTAADLLPDLRPADRRTVSPPPWFANPTARDWTCAPTPADVREFHAALPDYAATPLTELPALATRLGVGRVLVKDESSRLGLPAFKALGASWAVHRVLAERAGGPVLLVTATDGNHGRAVARMAARHGQRALVFVPSGLHPTAVAAIAAEGAQVTEVRGSYDDTVRHAASVAAADPGAVLVQDTAWPGYEQVPSWIVSGYATLFAELDAQLGTDSAALLVVPAGVGSLAQAAVTHYRSRPGGRATALLTVESQAAACVLTSLRLGRRVSVPTATTTMAGLNCGTPSSLAWPYLHGGLDAAVAVTDRDADSAARELTGLGVSSGPCGAAALAGADAALTGPGSTRRRADLGLGPTATVVLLSTEGRAANPALPAEARS
jgi:diaminopropionate ammonia-lyase